MSDPLPAPAFDLTFDVKPTDIGSGYAFGIEQARVTGKVPVAPSFAPLSRVTSLELHHYSCEPWCDPFISPLACSSVL